MKNGQRLCQYLYLNLLFGFYGKNSACIIFVSVICNVFLVGSILGVICIIGIIVGGRSIGKVMRRLG